MQKLLLATAFLVGATLTWIDTRPGWDDSGVTVALLLCASAALAFLSARRPWLLALAVGLWIPLVEVPRSQAYGALVALPLAFAGAYAGWALRHGLASARD